MFLYKLYYNWGGEGGYKMTFKNMFIENIEFGLKKKNT